MSNTPARDVAQALADEIQRLADIPNRTPDEERTLAALCSSAESVARDVKLEEIRHFASMPGHVEKEAEPAASFNVNRNRYADPWDYVRNGGYVGDIRDRALAATEKVRLEELDVDADATRSRISTLIDDTENCPGLDNYVAAVSNPHYATAFRKLLKHPQHAAAMMSDAERAAFAATQTPAMRTAMSTTAGNGGYLIPFHLDPTVILTNSGAKNPFRRISRVETITSNVWHGVSSAGVTAEWTAEASEFTDASPTFSQPTITPIKADAYIQASFEVTMDSNIDAQIGMLLADAKDRLEAAAFATGTGSTQPWGIVSRLAATTASRVTAQTNASFGAIDIFAVDNSLSARGHENPSWVGHWSIYNLVRQFATGTNTATTFWADLGPGIPPQLIGYPTYTSSSMFAAPLSTATASNDDILVLGDFSNYVIVDRVGMQVIYNPLVLGSNRRPTGENGWAAFWRVGADATNTDAFRLLRV